MVSKKIDIGIITALPDIELPAILKAFDIHPHRKEDELAEGYRYWLSSFESSRLNRELTVAITSIGTAGNISSVAATNQLIQKFKPDLLLFVGIAAGLEEKVKLSDVVVSENVFGYEMGRLIPDGMELRPKYEHPPHDILQDVYFFNQQVDHSILISFFNKLQNTLTSDQLPPNESTPIPKIHKGAIASGEKLFADGSLSEIRTKHDERIRAGEMEGIGFSSESERKRIPWLVIRGISDFGNPLTKEGRLKDKYHYTASNSAATWARLFLQYAYSGRVKPEITNISITEKILCDSILEKANSLIAAHGLDDDIWAKAISSQYFLVGLAKVLNLTQQKDYLNLLDKFLSSFHFNIQGELILEKNHMLITPEETEKIIRYMIEEDSNDEYYTKTKKMKADYIDASQMHNNYHYGLTLKISSSEKISVLDDIKKLSIDKLIKNNNSLDEYGGWYPYRVPFITARILISFKDCNCSEDEKINIIIRRALDSLIRRIYLGQYWRSGVGIWVSKWESTALCLEALDKWDYVKPNEIKVKKILKYVIENQKEWMMTPPDFSDEDKSNSTLSSVFMVAVLLKLIKNNFGFEEFSVDPIDFLKYFDCCMSVLNEINSPSFRQFCTIPQIVYYMSDAVSNYLNQNG